MTPYKYAWREAAWIFVISRLVILFATLIGVEQFPYFMQSRPQDCLAAVDRCLQVWNQWDNGHFVNIALNGYAPPYQYETAFYPLWPLLIHLVGSIFGGTYTTYYLVGLILSNVCFYLALVVLYRLVSHAFEASLARTTLLYMALGPLGIYYFVGYTEALFLLLCLGCFSFLQRRDACGWWLAGLCGCGAALTRPSGLLLAVAFLVVFVQYCQQHWRVKEINWWSMLNGVLPLGLIALGLLLFLLYLSVTTGNPFIGTEQEQLHWARHWALPWEGTGEEIRHLFLGQWNVKDVQDVLYTYVPLIALGIGWRRLPLHYSLFSLASILFFLSVPAWSWQPLASDPRFTMVLFPITILFALWSKHPRWHIVFQACSYSLFALNTVIYITGRPLA